ncbi:carbohydrate ABC transporter permease [Leadbettera azotonutricia]|uniref:Sugar ABC transporter permease n=1 Tax=Leadbettera azotonutricia (strain ATCC BAA-888 / DSM 13862 / ZAS-9) TaxID=545695 RepID=F5Y6U7_LEAAZ|nr:carbohydrate ABC transporter permease [Leadbettera azotonutricia]AEF82090.1 sugar ABC transporter permease [Leadbettera azotonutricia ZAS-9]
MKTKKSPASLLLIPAGIFLVLIILISIGPFLWVLLSSVKTNREILTFSFRFTNGVHWQNYVNAFKIAPIVRYFQNSVFITIMGVLLNLTVMSMAAYVLSRFSFRLRNFIRAFFAMGLLIPGAALLLPLYTSIKAVGLYNNVWGLIVVYTAFGIPVSVFIMSSYFLTIPKEMEESAYIDGAGFLKTFAIIILPLARPAFATAGIMQFLLCWNEFQFALTLTTGHDARTLPVALYYFKSAFASDYGAMFAAIVLVSLPSIIVYSLLQKQVVSGLAAGSVKG